MATLERISSELSNNPLGTVDTTLGKSQFHLCQLKLCSFSLFCLASLVQIVDLQTGLGIQVRDTGDGACASDRESGNEPVALSSESKEVFGLELSCYASNLCDTTTCQLHADNVGVLAQALEHL